MFERDGLVGKINDAEGVVVAARQQRPTDGEVVDAVGDAHDRGENQDQYRRRPELAAQGWTSYVGWSVHDTQLFHPNRPGGLTRSITIRNRAGKGISCRSHGRGPARVTVRSTPALRSRSIHWALPLRHDTVCEWIA